MMRGCVRTTGRLVGTTRPVVVVSGRGVEPTVWGVVAVGRVGRKAMVRVSWVGSAACTAHAGRVAGRIIAVANAGKARELRVDAVGTWAREGLWGGLGFGWRMYEQRDAAEHLDGLVQGRSIVVVPCAGVRRLAECHLCRLLGFVAYLHEEGELGGEAKPRGGGSFIVGERGGVTVTVGGGRTFGASTKFDDDKALSSELARGLIGY